jgi:hypothetical protein
MKSIFPIIGLIILTLSCNRKSKSNTYQEKYRATTDSNISVDNFVSLDSMEVREQRLRDTNYSFLDKLLDSTLNLIKKQDLGKPYSGKIDSTVFSFKNMYATISFGHLFAVDRQHLIIKRFINEYSDYETSLYSDIFLLDKNTFKKVAADTSDEGYGETYFEDVNHDGYKDYLVYSYSRAGCCPRNLEMGYIYNAQNGYFERIDLFNRETDSLTTNFFETSYGQDNYINLYKYKWQGLRKVLLEEIYVTLTKEGFMNSHPTSYTRVFYPSKKKQKIRKLPKEYARLKLADFISPIEN